MPAKYVKGDPKPWPRWGYQVTNETPDGFDLEVIFFQYVFMCTAGDGQMEKAKDVFLWCAADISKKRGKLLDPVPAVELLGSHIRNFTDGVCTVRVGKRVRFAAPRG